MTQVSCFKVIAPFYMSDGAKIIRYPEFSSRCGLVLLDYLGLFGLCVWGSGSLCLRGLLCETGRLN